MSALLNSIRDSMSDSSGYIKQIKTIYNCDLKYQVSNEYSACSLYFIHKNKKVN